MRHGRNKSGHDGLSASHQNPLLLFARFRSPHPEARAQRASKDAGHGAPLRRIRRPHAPADLHAVVAFDHRDLILALQIEPELRPVAGPPPRFRGAG
jgi:hypothetical protein